MSVDVVDEASVQKLFDGLPSTPDVLVNNSGVSLSQRSIVDSDVSTWWADWVSWAASEVQSRIAKRHIRRQTLRVSTFAQGPIYVCWQEGPV